MEKIKVLLLGASGMLGHMVLRHLLQNDNIEVIGTRRYIPAPTTYLVPFSIYDSVDQSIIDLIGDLGAWQPQYIINAIGAIKPYINDNDAESVYDAIRLNSVLPWSLHHYFPDAKIIHASTDCVFSGRMWDPDSGVPHDYYSENNLPDAKDMYGRSKALGECPMNMNMRVSIIGPEIDTYKSLLDWYLHQGSSATVKGFNFHSWNGFTTLQWAKTVELIIQNDLWEAGIYHFHSDAVTKAELLQLIKEEYERLGRSCANIEVVHQGEPKCMCLKTRNYQYLRRLLDAGYKIPNMRQQIREMAENDVA